VEVIPLYRDSHETVVLERWKPGAAVSLQSPAGLELLVLEGGFTDGEERFTYQSWLRLAPRSSVQAQAGAKGCRVWAKTGHLARQQPAPPVAG
jgi:hypothetical protein